jgi:hypothetical protein
MKIFEAGIIDIIYPYEVHWTGETSFAKKANDAMIDFEGRGFYRNLTVREVISDVNTRKILNESN